MARAQFQVAVFPFRQHDRGWEYALFKRSTGSYWQSIAGGGEDRETPEEAAIREAFEEAHIPPECPYFVLQTMAMVPAAHFKARSSWPDDVLVIPVHYFAVDVANHEIVISHEHSEFQWVTCDVGCGLLRWDSDKTALWELDQRLHKNLLKSLRE